jgi:hypothetical protein
MASIDGLAFQTALGRILAEPAINDRFVADPQGTGAALGLDAAQIAALEAAGVHRLRAFAHSLYSKRIELLRKVCPGTYELLQQRAQLAALAGRFVREHAPIESREYDSRTLRDGFWFLEFIVRLQERGELSDPLVAEVARFELAWLSILGRSGAVESAVAFHDAATRNGARTRDEILAARPRRGGHARIEAFSLDILPVMRALGEKRPPPASSGSGADDAEPTLVLFVKWPGWRNVRYATVNDATRQLFELCDGRATTHQIIAGLWRERSTHDELDAFTTRCLGLVERLAQINAITFEPRPC